MRWPCRTATSCGGPFLGDKERSVKGNCHPASPSGLPAVNRFAVVLGPTDEYRRWALACPDPVPGLTAENMDADSGVYLMPEFDYDEDAQAWLRQNYRPIFMEELNAWCTAPAYWPQDLSFETFQRFFRVRITALVFDLGRGPIERGC